ncbi:ABC transporter permease subunit [Dehalobacter sp. DCM]|uniref:ABC transporter permease n=1 Tax=Dehalobacter sp. DCM TaxID=2907827 RepID=UPI003081E02B|nr:ABC transporter permease subunit [Dehalobacter sp. DCM]
MIKKPFLLLLPVIVLSLLFVIGILNGLIQSFGIMPSLGLTVPTLKYYSEIFSRPDLLSAIGMSLYITLLSSIGAVVLGVFICALLVMSGKAKGRTLQLIKIPIAIPHTVVALFVILIFAQSGLLARVFYHLDIIASQDAFPALLYARNGLGIILAYIWKEVPFVVFFVVSIMANINTSLGEAAQNLGASRWRTFIDITLPLCMPSIKNAFLIIFAFSLGAYELPFLLGSTVPRALPVQAYIEYTHPDLLHRPYAMALNGILFIISFIIAFLYYRLLQHNVVKVNKS